MNYHQDITLLPGAEVNLYFLWQKIYQQMHLALVENKTTDNTSAIGLGFPEYDVENHHLGKKLRLFAAKEMLLQTLDAQNCLANLIDYVHLTQIRETPSTVSGHVCFKRVQFNSNPERLARRRAKRKGESLEQALKHYQKFDLQLTELPYVNMSSASNGSHFRLFIDKKLASKSGVGSFSCYGLSLGDATVPEF